MVKKWTGLSGHQQQNLVPLLKKYTIYDSQFFLGEAGIGAPRKIFFIAISNANSWPVYSISRRQFFVDPLSDANTIILSNASDVGDFLSVDAISYLQLSMEAGRRDFPLTREKSPLSDANSIYISNAFDKGDFFHDRLQFII